MKPTKEQINKKKAEVIEAISELNGMINELSESKGVMSIDLNYLPVNTIQGGKGHFLYSVTIDYNCEV